MARAALAFLAACVPATYSAGTADELISNLSAACPAGTNSAGSSGQCEPCSSNTFWSAGRGAGVGSSCQACPVGTLSAAGALACQACALGQIMDPLDQQCFNATVNTSYVVFFMPLAAIAFGTIAPIAILNLKPSVGIAAYSVSCCW